MDSTAISTSTTTPPYHHHSRSEPPSRAKSASRLAHTGHIPHLSLGLIKSSPKRTPSPSAHSRKSSESLPLRELLLLSSPPVQKRSKTRLMDRFEMADDPAVEVPGPRRRCKGRGSQMGLLGCASPRNTRRLRRRSETETREEKDSGLVEEMAKPRKRRSKKEKPVLVPCLPSPSSSSIDDEYRGSLDRIGQLMSDMVMWRDVASIFSAISHIGLLFLGASFVSNSICQRNNIEKKRDFILKEDDILGVAKRILPAVNLAFSKMRAPFSGEPSMTLKVAPLFLLGAEYGHLITLWRLCVLAFFVSFTIPKLHSCYASQINQKVDCLKWGVLEAWGACSHKRIVAASAATALWNLSSVKTRIFTAFVSLVILRYYRQHMEQPMENGEAEVEQEQHQALVVVVPDVVAEAEADADGKQEQTQALVVAEVASNQ